MHEVLLCKSIAKQEMCHFLAPAGQPEMMHKNFMHQHLRIFVVQCSCMKFYADEKSAYFYFSLVVYHILYRTARKSFLR